MRSTRLVIAAIAVAGTGAVACGGGRGPVATPAPAPASGKTGQVGQIVRTPLLTAQLQAEKLVDRVEVKKIQFAPLQQTGLHLHPVPVVGYVASGTVHFQVEGEAEKTLSAGDAFFEPANTRIIRFDNASDREEAIFIAYYLLGKGEDELIRMLE